MIYIPSLIQTGSGMERLVTIHVVPERFEFVFIGSYENESSKYDDPILGYLKYQNIYIL
jgi:hypothetical protein